MKKIIMMAAVVVAVSDEEFARRWRGYDFNGPLVLETGI